MLKYLTILSLLSGSLTAFGFSIQQAMQTAFERNPKTQANELRLKAMEERTKAAWLSFLPRFYTGYSAGSDRSRSDSGMGWDASRSSSQNINYGLSFNIYDGGVRYYNAKSAEAGEKMRRAQYNSTDSRIPNTRGAIAEQVFNAYTNVLRFQETIAFELMILEAQVKILKIAKTPEEQNRIKSLIASSEARLSNARFELADAARDFENVVKIPMPQNIENYEQTVASIIVPPNHHAAIEVALTKSPELNVASYQLEQMNLEFQADRASMTRPTISVNISKSHGLNNSANDPFNARSDRTTAIASITWSLSPPESAFSKAAALEIEALQKDKDGVLDDLKFNIESAYPRLENFSSSAEQYNQILKNGKRALNSALEKIDNGDEVKVDDALSLIGVLQAGFYPAVVAKQSLLIAKFSLQKTIGTLFDEVTAHYESTAGGKK